MRGHFDWRSLGKADYAQAHALVASLPSSIRLRFRGLEREILCRLLYLTWRFALTGGRGRGYCIPSERWLASIVNRSERTIRRYLVALRGLGLISWVRRKSANNDWQTNLYSLGTSFLAMLYAKTRKKYQRNHQRTLLADNDLKKEYKPDDAPEVRALIAEIGAKTRRTEELRPSGTAPLPALDSWDEEPDLTERRTMLRKQAQSLIARGL